MAFELQRSFAAGELDPKSWLRSDLDMHAQAVRKMLNVVADPHGPAISRSGFGFIEELEDEIYCRIFDFDVSFAESYIIAITPNKIYVLDKSGFTQDANVITNPSFSDGSIGWISERTLFVNGIALLQALPGLSAYFRQQVTVDDDGANVHQLRLNVTDATSSVPVQVRIGTTEGATDIFNGLVIGSILIEFTPGVNTFWVEVFTAAGAANKEIDSISVREEPQASAGNVEFPSPYSAQDIRELQIDKTPGNKIMYLVTRGVAPQQLTYVEGHIWDFGPIEFDFGTDEEDPPQPLPPLWDDEFPGCIAFHDGRMVLGGTYSKPVHIWMSVPQQYTNFTLGSSAADAMELPLDKHGELHWLRSNTQLFAGLDTGEHILFGNNGPIAPDNAQTEQQSSYGSARIHAFIIDERVAYTDTAGSTIRVMDYSDDAKAYISNNITFQAEHITKDRIIEAKYGISPRGLIYCPTFAGTLVIASIENDQGTLGWHEHDTQGFILSVAITKEFGLDVPWITVVREGKLYIERYDMGNEYFSDSYKVVSLATESTFFDGLDHLIGKTVQVIADGKVHPDLVVQPDGSITIEYEALEVVVGLGFTALVETLPSQKDTQSGNTLAFTKRYSELYIILGDSPRPKVNGFDPYKRYTPTPMGTREQNESGLLVVTNTAGWSAEATVEVKQELALPMRLYGIGGKLKENKV